MPVFFRIPLAVANGLFLPGIALSLLVSLLLSPGLAPAQSPAPGLDAVPELDGLAASWADIMDLFNTPGMAVAVVKNDTVYVAALGFRDPESRAPVTPNTLFYIASVTKTYTAAGIHLLAEERRLGLEDPVRKYLPRLELPDPTLTERLTVRDLLGHRYGIKSGPAVSLDAYTGEITEDRYFHWLAQSEVAGKIDYSNVHFTLLGRVLEAVTGEPWRDILERRVFRPAGMSRTGGYISRLWTDPDHAVPTARTKDGWRPTPRRKTDRTMHAAGGLYTTALDGGRWMRLFLGGGAIDGTRILPPEAVEDMLTVHARFDEPDGSIRVIDGFGSAWQLGTFNGHRLAMHSGGYPGCSAHCALLPDDGEGVFVLINADGAARGLGTIAAVEVLERLTGTESPWNVRERYAERAKKMKAEEEGIEPAETGIPVLPLSTASRPPGLYEGAFRNPWWGTLTVGRVENGFIMHLGDFPMDIAPAADMPDAFTTSEMFDGPVTGRFVVEANGCIERIVISDPKRGEFEFVR